MIGYTISYLDKLLVKYGPLYPRRTEITTFHEVEARKVALSNLTIGYDRESGLLGHQVKPDETFAIVCSEYDKILLIFKDGRYKVINAADKLFVGHDLLWADKVVGGTVFNLMYKEGKQNHSYVKRFKTPKFILFKEYRLFPEHNKSVIQFLRTGEGVRLRVDFKPTARAKSNSQRLHLDDYLIKNAGAIGKRLSNRPVRRITELVGKPSEAEEDELDTLEGAPLSVSSVLESKPEQSRPVSGQGVSLPEEERAMDAVAGAAEQPAGKKPKPKPESDSGTDSGQETVQEENGNKLKDDRSSARSRQQLGLFDLPKKK
jgi:hypothetical protein